MSTRHPLFPPTASGLALLICGLILVIACTPTEPASDPARSPVEALVANESLEGFAQAETVREFVFPQDHGPHPEFQTEWWYFTGHLESPAGRRFGMQWTIFRRALTPDMPERTSSWASRQLYMGHVALTDPEKGWHLSEERFARGGGGLAGAEIGPLRVWLEDWQALSASPDELWPLRLTTRSRTSRGHFALDLDITNTKPMVLQGDRGLSWKHEGGASYYYSFTRLDAEGTVTVGDETFTVRGNAWLDREWSTSTLAANQTGWDWFSLQLDDGRELMFYKLRLEDDSPHPLSAGVLVDKDGAAVRLALDDVDIEATDSWRSPRSGGVYPTRWRLRVPDHDLDLEILPLMEDQELDIQFRYWEGAVDVEGTSAGQALGGRGYVELVGYADRTPVS